MRIVFKVERVPIPQSPGATALEKLLSKTAVPGSECALWPALLLGWEWHLESFE